MSQEIEFTENRVLASGLKEKRIVITRAEHQVQELAQLLRSREAEPVLYPCIRIVPPDNTQALDNALQKAAQGDFDWLIITSTNTVNILRQRLDKLNLQLDNINAAAIGPRTAAAAAKQLHIDIDVVPDSYVVEGLIEALPPLKGRAVLLPQASLARSTLAEELFSKGAYVTAVEAYQIGKGQGGASVPQMLAAGHIDAVIFSSHSTARYFLDRLRDEGGHRDDLIGVCLAALGPVTAKGMKDLDLPVHVQSDRYTLADLVDALEEYYTTLPADRLKNNQEIYE